MRTADALARVNVNLPAEARDKLRHLAKAAGRPEAAYARDLLLDALERAETTEFRRRLAASRTPERRKRDLEIVAALERLRG